MGTPGFPHEANRWGIQNNASGPDPLGMCTVRASETSRCTSLCSGTGFTIGKQFVGLHTPESIFFTV